MPGTAWPTLAGLGTRRRAPNPGPPPAPPTAPAGIPADQAQVVYLQQLEAWQLAADAYGRYLQLDAGVEQAEAQVDQLDEQLDAALEQAEESADQQAQQEGFTDEQEALADQQEALGDDQKALGDDQQDLAEEQKDIADVRAKPIQVRDIAEVRQELAPSTVTQIDGVRAVTLTATPDADDLGALTETVQQRLDALELPASVDVELGGASDDQAEAFRELGLAMLLAIVLVFLIMVGTFRSLIQPLILLTAIPFAATGAVAGLLITDTALGVPAMVGLLMLIGIVVTNAIVLIDLINKKRATGEELRSAVTHGARLRLRPIIMTATATICALIPMGLGLTGGGAFISQPLAIVVIGGLISSTVLTLLLVPVLYSLVERRSERKRLAAAPGSDHPGNPARSGSPNLPRKFGPPRSTESSPFGRLRSGGLPGESSGPDDANVDRIPTFRPRAPGDARRSGARRVTRSVASRRVRRPSRGCADSSRLDDEVSEHALPFARAEGRRDVPGAQARAARSVAKVTG